MKMWKHQSVVKFIMNQKIVKKDEIKSDSSSELFIQGVLSSFLEQKGVHNVIRKNSKNDNTSKMDLQLIFNGDAFNQIS